MSDPDYTDVACRDEIPERGFVTRQVGDTEIVLCRSQDRVYAVENRCSHAFAKFDGGRLRGHRLMCPLHGACFDVRDGQPLGRPAVRPIRTFPVRLEGERVLVGVAMA